MNKRLYLIILFFAITMTSVAQTEDERYRAIYDQAEQDYNIGRILEARQALTTNMNNFPLSLRLGAYRLLSLCELTLDNTDAANKAIKAIEDPAEKKAFIAEKEAEYKDKFASPYQAANRGYIDDVIEPRNTRARIIRAFEMLQTKRLTNPLKKHSNIPL